MENFSLNKLWLNVPKKKADLKNWWLISNSLLNRNYKLIANILASRCVCLPSGGQK